MRGIVLHSGGIDSTVCLSLALNECTDVISFGLNYGAKHGKREAEAAREIAHMYDVVREERNLPDIFGGAGSTLIDPDLPNPQVTYEELREAQGPSPTYVPFRNANLLSVATSIALREEADFIYFGAHADDAHNWAYPDCTPEFIGAMANAIYVGTYQKVRLRTPFTFLTKAQVVEIGARSNAPLGVTYSCYEGRELHCGKCPACVSRIEAFKVAGVDDSTEYEA